MHINKACYNVLFAHRYESCNTWECPIRSIDSRLEQCQKYDGNNFNLVGIVPNVKWLPKYTGSELLLLLNITGGYEY